MKMSDVYSLYLDDIEKLQDQNADLSKKVKELEERLADADKTIKMCDELWGQHYTIADGTTMGNSPAWKYMLKWGVK